MAHETLIMEIMETLKISDKQIIGELMSSRGIWTAGTSSINNAYKALTVLADLGKLVKGLGYFKIPNCKSEYQEHARLLTKVLGEILKVSDAIIYRELTIPEIGLRPDAAVLLTREGKGKCFILEVVNNETEPYLNQKITALRTWKHSLTFLSELFKYKIPHFDIVTAGDSTFDGTLQLKSYLEEVK